MFPQGANKYFYAEGVGRVNILEFIKKMRDIYFLSTRRNATHVYLGVGAHKKLLDKHAEMLLDVKHPKSLVPRIPALTSKPKKIFDLEIVLDESAPWDSVRVAEAGKEWSE